MDLSRGQGTARPNERTLGAPSLYAKPAKGLKARSYWSPDRSGLLQTEFLTIRG